MIAFKRPRHCECNGAEKEVNMCIPCLHKLRNAYVKRMDKIEEEMFELDKLCDLVNLCLETRRKEKEYERGKVV